MTTRVRGRCQTCGCEVPVRLNGVIARHRGATANETCSGAGHKPFPAYDVLEIEFQKAVAEFNSTPAGVRDLRENWFRFRPQLLELGDRLFEAKIAELPEAEREEMKAEYEFVKRVLGFREWTGIRRILWEAESWAKYGHCRICGNEVTAEQYQWARRRIEPPVCGHRCREVEIFKRYGCCEKAHMIPCVCLHSFECPEHGTKHIGTHD